MSNMSIVRERDVAGGESERPKQSGVRGKIVGEIIGDVSDWRKVRDDIFEAVWDEYYAKWRGFWMPEHKNYKTERSKLISPLTSMAVDITTAEIVESVFGREYFIDLPDDYADQQKEDMEFVRNMLVEELKNQDFVDEFALTALNGALYGTGIMKIQVYVESEKVPDRGADGKLIAATRERVVINPVCIDPDQFVPDPSVRSIDKMKGCAHEFMMPLHLIRQRQDDGTYYRDVSVGAWDMARMHRNKGDAEGEFIDTKNDAAFITEYYGIIPKNLLVELEAEQNGVTLDPEVLDAVEGDVEVIATIANETHLLRIIENPLITGERLICSYQHESVSGRFWGRGVAEKGASIQRAMDAEMRARIDGLAWSNNPMFAGDLTRLPPGSNLSAWPGKFWGTRGNPAEIIQEFKISGPDQTSFAHMADLERMGQQATGALDTMSMRNGMRDETATGGALAASGFIKRSKRTMYNIEGFMNRLIRRVVRLKMQYQPHLYKEDYNFSVRGTMGIMARELEQKFLVNLVSVLGPESPASMPIIQAVFEHSGSPVKSDVLAKLREMENKKPTPEEEAARAASLKIPVLQANKLEAEVRKLYEEADLKDAQADKLRADGGLSQTRSDVEKLRAVVDVKEVQNQERQMDLSERKLQLDEKKLQIAASKELHKQTQDRSKKKD